MEATAIATLAFIFAATALTVLITLCYKGGNRGSSHREKTVVSIRGRSNRDVETEDVVDHDTVKNIAVAPVAASAVMYDGGNGGVGGGDGDHDGGGEAEGEVVVVERLSNE
ncbi:hypothetical protein E3N88_08820 [Mikania micrantha]|uniref:Uncharacterized protein n=1 Tax=Mikania micrantha TaxID=192012 RepID=A0A5N6PHE0_9ASTR|nr:hypothetical protein E3N88_08820 [Mikania micrantha]